MKLGMPKGETARKRQGREERVQGREDNQYQMKSLDKETAPGKLQGFYISTSAVSLAVTICSFKICIKPVATPSQEQCQ